MGSRPHGRRSDATRSFRAGFSSWEPRPAHFCASRQSYWGEMTEEYENYEAMERMARELVDGWDREPEDPEGEDGEDDPTTAGER